MHWKEVAFGVLAGLGCSAGGWWFYRQSPDVVRPEKYEPLKKRYIAHRGLFDNKTKRVENSIPAFAYAVEEDFGIELDVQMTADGKLVVFHDDTLSRMCGVDQILTDLSYEELEQYTLLDSGEKIPLFDDVLKVIDGKVPLLVEIKSSGDWLETTRKVASRMEKYNGFFGILSFSPLVLNWLKLNRPAILRGQLSTNYFKTDPQKRFGEKFTLTNLLQNNLSRPEMIAYDCLYKDEVSFILFKKLFPEILTVGWTFKSQQELNSDKRDFDCYIFDSFIPKR